MEFFVSSLLVLRLDWPPGGLLPLLLLDAHGGVVLLGPHLLLLVPVVHGLVLHRHLAVGAVAAPATPVAGPRPLHPAKGIKLYFMFSVDF
jgi:hypothetical protein